MGDLVIPDISIWRSQKDEHITLGFMKHINMLEQKGVTIWDSFLGIDAGQNMKEEVITVAYCAEIAILLISVDFLSDTLMQYMMRRLSSVKTLIAILLRPCSYHYYTDLPPMNKKPVSRMNCYEREDLWVNVCEKVVRLLNKNIITRTMLTRKDLLDDYEVLKKYGFSVSLLSGSTNGAISHGLGGKPDNILVAPEYGQNIVLGDAHVTITAAPVMPYTALGVKKPR